MNHSQSIPPCMMLYIIVEAHFVDFNGLSHISVSLFHAVQILVRVIERVLLYIPNCIYSKRQTPSIVFKERIAAADYIPNLSLW